MASHLNCIGFSVDDPADLEAIVQEAAGTAIPVEVRGGTYLHWSSGTGAELWLQVNRRKELIGAQPHFAGHTSMPVAVTGVVARPDDSELDGAFHCWANPSSDEPDSGDYPFVFDAPDFHVHSANLALPSRGTVQLAAFAEKVRVFPSPEAFEQEATGKPRFAVESFVPAGLFRPGAGATDPPTAHAILTGRVLESGGLENALSKRRFLWAAVKTLGGTVDVVLDAADAPGGIPNGGVLQGTFWLSGRLGGYPVRAIGDNDSGRA